MSKIEIYSADSITEAHLLQGLLAQFNIDAEVAGQYLQGGLGELPAMNLIRLLVEEHAAERARDVIERYERGEFAVDENDEDI